MYWPSKEFPHELMVSVSSFKSSLWSHCQFPVPAQHTTFTKLTKSNWSNLDSDSVFALTISLQVAVRHPPAPHLGPRTLLQLPDATWHLEENRWLWTCQLIGLYHSPYNKLVINNYIKLMCFKNQNNLFNTLKFSKDCSKWN